MGWSLVNDAYSAENFWLTVTRTAHTSATINFPATVTAFQIAGGRMNLGTAANPRLYLYNNAGTASELQIGADSGAAWIGTFTNSEMGFYANSVKRMTINTDGTFTFFNGTPAQTLRIVNTGTDTIVSAFGTNGYGAFYPQGSGTNSAYLFFGNATNSERGRIWSDNSRNMVFSNDSGTTNHMLLGPTGNLSVSGQIVAGTVLYATNGVSATSGASFEPQINLFNTNNDNTASYLIFNKNPADTTMSTNDTLGNIIFYGRGSSSLGGGTQIVSTYTGTRGTNWVSSQLQIGVTNTAGVMQWNYFNSDGTISGAGVSTSATANTLAKRDASGDLFSRYNFVTYNNSTDDTTTSGITFIMSKMGDNYYRSANALKVNTFLLGTPGSSTYQPVGGYTNSNQWGANLLTNMNQAAGNTLSDQRTGFFTANNPTNSPNGDWVHWINHFGYGWGSGAEYGFQIAHGFWANTMWVRKINNGTWGSWVKLWTADNDGSGSGLDADLWDGNEFATYLNQALLTSSSPTFIGLTLGGLLVGRTSASTDVNTANDTGSLSVRGNTTTVAVMSFHRAGAYAINMGLGTDNVFRIGGWSAANNCLQLDGSGNLTALSNISAYSDRELKEDFVVITSALDKVSQLTGYTYTRKDTKERNTGLVAQDVEAVLPEAVSEIDGIKTLAYGNLMGLMVQAIKELRAEIEELKNGND
jgi:hypothetical protein